MDAAGQQRATALRSLSELTSVVALQYLERIAKPTPALTLANGVSLTTGGYAAHLAVEADPAAFEVADVPVLATLPPLRNGRPPQDLVLRVVKATRRSFPSLCAVAPEVWEGLVDASTRRADDRTVADAEPLDRPVVDALLRFGWLLRQVDLHYGLEPERASREH